MFLVCRSTIWRTVLVTGLATVSGGGWGFSSFVEASFVEASFAAGFSGAAGFSWVANFASPDDCSPAAANVAANKSIATKAIIERQMRISNLQNFSGHEINTTPPWHAEKLPDYFRLQVGSLAGKPLRRFARDRSTSPGGGVQDAERV